jgi:hypothetical protein
MGIRLQPELTHADMSGDTDPMKSSLSHLKVLRKQLAKKYGGSR